MLSTIEKKEKSMTREIKLKFDNIVHQWSLELLH